MQSGAGEGWCMAGHGAVGGGTRLDVEWWWEGEEQGWTQSGGGGEWRSEARRGVAVGGVDAECGGVEQGWMWTGGGAWSRA